MLSYTIYRRKYSLKSTKITLKIQKKLQTILRNNPLILTIVKIIDQKGGRAYLVGGAVRDLLLGFRSKDLDIEVHNITLAQLEGILKEYGVVNLVGKSFGVLRLESLDVDWSIPRMDKAGRKPKVTLDPFLSIKKAFERRDVTINAMGIDLVNYALIDPFNGFEDLKKGILRATNKKSFLEDPLRFYRVMQFVARFGMTPDKTLNNICKNMNISTVSKERIEGEFKKWLLKSEKPSLALDWLKKIDRLSDILPEIAALQGVPQNPVWHPEGDVFEHTKQTIDAAAQLEYATEQEKLMLMYAALCHDIGKAKTTKIEEKITSYEHAKVGALLTKKLLKRITNNVDLIKTVCKMVGAHMYPLQLANSSAKLNAYKRLAYKMAPNVTLAMIAKLALADRQGRNPKKGKPLSKQIPEVDFFLKKAAAAHALNGVEEKIVQGRDLMPDIEPGPLMGSLVKKAYSIQLNEGITNKKVLKQRVLALAKQKKSGKIKD